MWLRKGPSWPGLKLYCPPSCPLSTSSHNVLLKSSLGLFFLYFLWEKFYNLLSFPGGKLLQGPCHFQVVPAKYIKLQSSLCLLSGICVSVAHVFRDSNICYHVERATTYILVYSLLNFFSMDTNTHAFFNIRVRSFYSCSIGTCVFFQQMTVLRFNKYKCASSFLMVIERLLYLFVHLFNKYSYMDVTELDLETQS